MRLGFLQDLQNELGVGRTYASALKNAAGYRGGKFDIDGCVEWLRQNKDFICTSRARQVQQLSMKGKRQRKTVAQKGGAA